MTIPLMAFSIFLFFCDLSMSMKSLLISSFLFFLCWVPHYVDGQTAPRYSYTAIHCDPQPPLLWPILTQMVDSADAYGVPLTIEFSPPWVNLILSNSTFRDTVDAWRLRGHEIAGHHHGIYHCSWDSLTNYPPDSIIANQPTTPLCDSGAFKSGMQPFYDSLNVLASDSAILTWASSDSFPAVDFMLGVPYRTDGGREVPWDAFSNVAPEVLDQTLGYGPYNVCDVGHCFVDSLWKVDSIVNTYFNFGFSSQFDVVSINTHVFNVNSQPDFFPAWLAFAANGAQANGTVPLTVRQIMRELCSINAVQEEPSH